MKKSLLLFVLISGMVFGQFTVESSSDWKFLGKYKGSVELYTKGSTAKIKLIDVRSDSNPMNVKAESRTVFDDINKNLKDIKSGISNNYHEFIFPIEDDTLDKIHAIITEHFKTKKIEEVTLGFPDGNLYLNFKKDVFEYLVSFGIDSNGQKIYSGNYAKAGVDRMFGKK